MARSRFWKVIEQTKVPTRIDNDGIRLVNNKQRSTCLSAHQFSRILNVLALSHLLWYNSIGMNLFPLASEASSLISTLSFCILCLLCSCLRPSIDTNVFPFLFAFCESAGFEELKRDAWNCGANLSRLPDRRLEDHRGVGLAAEAN